MDLLQQVFQQYGLAGLLVAALILGPVLTYFRTRNLQTRVEARAQDLVNQFAREERQRAERLERQLRQTAGKLTRAEEELLHLRGQLADNQRELQALPQLRQQVDQLMHRVSELEMIVAHKDQELARKEQRIHELEQTLLLQQHPVRPARLPDNALKPK